ncbi:hypothetical protein TWF191_010430 [Orbilia oligospora]|uniref:Glycoside hydrolase family 125 protein n=1 Tax=Orbilia oligospora TaxID=2813651 RepID=A0A7C8QGX2_ORBOL|nr:hypothetical protein TWF191_010430 [Orbilia oligospora]
MYHRTPRPVPDTPSSDLPLENQLVQQPPYSPTEGSATSGHHLQVPEQGAAPFPFQPPPRRGPSTYRPPSPSKHPHSKPTYNPTDSDDRSWLSASNILMFLLTAIILVLLFFQTPGSSQVLYLNDFDGDPWGDSCPDYKDYSSRRHLPLSDGPLQLPFQRPVPECRSFRSNAVERVIRDITTRLVDRDLARLFENCYPSTLDTTVRWHVTGEETEDAPAGFSGILGDDKVKGAQSFIVTGDINAEWLRDSTNQLAGYMPLLRKDEKLRKLVWGAINTQAGYVIESPYCNAFQPPRGSHVKPSGVLQFPGYTFQRSTNIGTETLSLSGRGNPLNGNSSLIRSAFRPSDDACILQYFIPGNAFMSVELGRLSKLLADAKRKDHSNFASDWSKRIADGVKAHGIVDDPVFGKVYAYEVDGYGSRIMMDDANLPSLLSLPKLGWTTVNDPVYQNTRKMILSREGNPFFLEGPVFKGIGGPHIGLKHAWPMSLLMQAMTSDDDKEIMAAIDAVKTVSRFGLINESVNVNRQGDYTRSWFAWANSVFAQAILDLAKRKPYLIFGAGAEPYEL